MKSKARRVSEKAYDINDVMFHRVAFPCGPQKSHFAYSVQNENMVLASEHPLFYALPLSPARSRTVARIKRKRHFYASGAVSKTMQAIGHSRHIHFEVWIIFHVEVLGRFLLRRTLVTKDLLCEEDCRLHRTRCYNITYFRSKRFNAAIERKM